MGYSELSTFGWNELFVECHSQPAPLEPLQHSVLSEVPPDAIDAIEGNKIGYQFSLLEWINMVINCHIPVVNRDAIDAIEGNKIGYQFSLLERMNMVINCHYEYLLCEGDNPVGDHVLRYILLIISKRYTEKIC